ncbi:MAG: hypothetical protein E7Z80_01985 [Methanobrevibacter thaueri]|nr:hypothetical protein [Methanobrevibacter thaueri]
MNNSILEISIILIIILMISGIILTNIENSTEKIIKSQENNNMEKLIAEVIDNLINNPGTPENWNENKKGTPGLAIINDEGQIIPNSISYAKLIALGNDYNKLVTQKIFNSKIKTQMELQPQQSSIASVKIGETNTGNTIYSLTRLVKCDFYKKYVLKDYQNPGKCNRNHNQEEYSCDYFKIFKGNVKTSDYYLILDNTEDDVKYIVETTRVVKQKYWQSPTSDVIYLNNKIDFYDDTSAIVFVHLDKKNPKAVLVSVPKNFEKEYLEYDYFRTNDCQFIIQAWY